MIRLVVIMYVRYPLLHNVEDLLAQRGIEVDLNLTRHILKAALFR